MEEKEEAMKPFSTDVVFKKFSLCLIICFVLCFLPGCTGQNQPAVLEQIQGRTMGTTFVVKYKNTALSNTVPPLQQVEKEINELLIEVNRQMSTYISDSEISRFNQYAETDWFPVSEDFAKVVQFALKISEDSRGAFDVTIGPLVNLWGFGPKKQENVVPDETEIEKLLSEIGYGKLAVRNTPPAIKKDVSTLYCDLSAIAKGFGVDKIADYLDKLGIEDYMVEIGGEVRVKGSNQKNISWRIGIEVPDDGGGQQSVVALEDVAMATSGDYRNYFEKDGERYSHTIDPRNGWPIRHTLASVTVIHPSCAIADAIATTINVLGPEAGLQFAQEQKLPIFIITKEKGEFVEKMTPSFKKYLLN